MKIKIDNKNMNQRIDRFVLKKLSGFKRSDIYRLFRKKKIKLNNERAVVSTILKEGDIVDIAVNETHFIKEVKKTKDVSGFLDIIYEDKSSLVVYKPKGILSVPRDNKEISLTCLVQKYVSNKDYSSSPITRLDYNTEGLMYFSKNYQDSIKMNKLMRERKIIKKYIALVHGIIEKDRTVELKIEKNKNENKVFYSKKGKTIITDIKPMISNDLYTLVELDLITGKTHQLRYSLSYINNPIVGDSKYGNDRGSQFLIAYKLEYLDKVISYIDDFKLKEIERLFGEKLFRFDSNICKRIRL